MTGLQPMELGEENNLLSQIRPVKKRGELSNSTKAGGRVLRNQGRMGPMLVCRKGTSIRKASLIVGKRGRHAVVKSQESVRPQ